MPRKSFDTLADNLHDVMVETLPAMVDKHIKEQVVKQVPEQVRNQVSVYVAEGLILKRQKGKEETEILIVKGILQEHENIQAQILTQIENAIANVIPSQVDASVQTDPQIAKNDIAKWLALQMKFERYSGAKWQKTSEYEAYVSGESSSGQSGYKNLNKNDTEDIYLLIMNGKKVNLTTPTMTFPGIEDHEMFSIIYEPMHGIIYKNSKKEKRVMRHSEIYMFCDATLNRVLEGLKSYNNDVKYGYVQKDITKDETEYLKLFEEDIKERLKH
ncbi:hypothetical protein Tco_1176935 [Tanacetum coccineum]